MPYDNDYNARIAKELGRSNRRFADYHAFDNIVGRGGAMGSGYGHFKLGNASKEDGLDGMYNNKLNLPKAYYGLEGGSGFAEGSFRDTGEGSVLGAGKGMKEYDKCCEGGNIFHDIWDGIKAVPDSLKSLPNALLNEAKKLKSAVGLGMVQPIKDEAYKLQPDRRVPPKEARVIGGKKAKAKKEEKEVGEDEAKEWVGSMMGCGKMTKKRRTELQRIFKKQGKMMGGAFWDSVADWGKKQLKDQGDNPYAKAGLEAIKNIGYGKMKGGAFWDKLADWGKKQLKEQGDNPYAKAGLQGIQDIGYGMSGGTLLGNPDRPKEVIGFGKMDEEIKMAVAKKLKGKGKLKTVESQMPSSSMSGFGKSDGRKKRAEIVKKVMAEKGLKMIEASKYVKQHGLYKP